MFYTRPITFKFYGVSEFYRMISNYFMYIKSSKTFTVKNVRVHIVNNVVNYFYLVNWNFLNLSNNF